MAKGFKIFNEECFESCPDNSDDTDNDGTCLCSFFYYKNHDTNLFICLGENELCSNQGYLYKIMMKDNVLLPRMIVK